MDAKLHCPTHPDVPIIYYRWDDGFTEYRCQIDGCDWGEWEQLDVTTHTSTGVPLVWPEWPDESAPLLWSDEPLPGTMHAAFRELREALRELGRALLRSLGLRA